MGGTLPRAGGPIEARAHVEGVAGGRLALTVDGRRQGAALPIAGVLADVPLLLPKGAARWFRVDVLRADGRLWLIGNPIYVR